MKSHQFQNTVFIIWQIHNEVYESAYGGSKKVKVYINFRGRISKFINLNQEHINK